VHDTHSAVSGIGDVQAAMAIESDPGDGIDSPNCVIPRLANQEIPDRIHGYPEANIKGCGSGPDAIGGKSACAVTGHGGDNPAGAIHSADTAGAPVGDKDVPG